MLGATSNIALIVYPSSFYETRCKTPYDLDNCTLAPSPSGKLLNLIRVLFVTQEVNLALKNDYKGV